ncbi:hypothetical protein GOP47_0023492 [Adiantum capillus-veneris]|uniref:Uncharacterized protein n=1 Tax=Adiantum capillus-veneris TaxID=13818 RepID=A0A9D4U4M3_ADICA|nr:hypothetical protein GOP47_0023492 [Adiantum capillus-veneris]
MGSTVSCGTGSTLGLWNGFDEFNGQLWSGFDMVSLDFCALSALASQAFCWLYLQQHPAKAASLPSLRTSDLKVDTYAGCKWQR